MKFTFAIIATFSIVICQTTVKIGNSYYSNDGTVTTKIGNSYYSNDGTVTTKIGNSYFRNDGTVTTKIGNSFYNSNGSAATKIGNAYYSNDGSTTIKIGKFYYQDSHNENNLIPIIDQNEVSEDPDKEIDLNSLIKDVFFHLNTQRSKK